MTPLIFIDESGDVGMGNKEGTSKLFVLTFVVFDDFLEAEQTGIKIKVLRRERFKNDYQEFHFTRDSIATKRRFFEEISKFKFKVKSFVIDKSKVDTIKFKNNQNFYELFLLDAIKNFSPYLSNSKLHIDGRHGDLYKRQLLTSIRKICKNEKIKINHIQFLDSKNDTLIQLADMCSGLIKRFLENPNNDIKELYFQIKKRVEVVYFTK